MVGLVELGLNWIVFLTIAHADSTLSLYLIKRDVTLTPVIQELSNKCRTLLGT